MLPSNNSLDYQKVKEVFVAALDVVPEKRRAFLAQQSADAGLLAEVESLLEAREEAGEFLNDVSAADTIQQLADHNGNFIGRKIGHYRLEKEIGRGGMGIVFLAVREDFRQQAAVKLIKRGMDSDAILQRFNREREILAALNHPFIARLTDGGTTEDDVPFFVMEYVEGVPVDEYCRSGNLPEKETLELFRKICEAVAFAHQKLVVHRDLKPSNILVTAEGTPKLLDFGIAKLLNSTDANETHTNQRALTPAYASPEQISGKPIDTTSDVYSLGKILAELLQNKNAPAEPGKSPPTVPKNNLDTDLQNILAMALREDNARRYGSVEKFSEDLRRYLAGLPVAARKDTFSYRTAKFIRRKRYALLFALLFGLTLCGGLLATLWQAREARRERETAERRFENLRKVSGSFVTEIHAAIRDLPGSLPARQMLLMHAVEQLDALAAESDGDPMLQDELAQAYFNYAELPDVRLAEKDIVFKKEIAIYQKLIAADPRNIHYREQTALADLELGDAAKVRGSVAQGIELKNRGVVLLEQIAGEEPENPAHWINLATGCADIAGLYMLKGDAEAARRATGRELAAVDKLRELNPSEPRIIWLLDLAHLQTGGEETLAGNYESGIAILRRSLADFAAMQIESPNDTRINYYLWSANRRLAESLETTGDAAAAFEHFKTALAIIENLLAESPKDFGYHRNSAFTNILYGQTLARRKHPAEAVKFFRRAVELSEKVVKNDADNAESKADLAWASGSLGDALFQVGSQSEGLNYLTEAVKIFDELCPADVENIRLQANGSQSRDWLKSDSLLAEIKK